MLKKLSIIILITLTAIFAQKPYNVGDTVAPADNLTWTDSNGYTTNIFDEISVNNNVVVIFWGGAG